MGVGVLVGVDVDVGVGVAVGVADAKISRTTSGTALQLNKTRIMTGIDNQRSGLEVGAWSSLQFEMNSN